MLPLYGYPNAARTVEACFLLGRRAKHFAQQRRKLRNDTGPDGLWTLGRVDRLLCRGRLVVPLSPLEKPHHETSGEPEPRFVCQFDHHGPTVVPQPCFFPQNPPKPSHPSPF